MTRSPYELTAAPGLLARLHPRLQRYFGAIPPGHVGRGTGVFSVVGTPRRWLWPVFALLARDGVLFPVWEHDVPFTVENRPLPAAVRARRTFRLRAGDRVMVDAITAEPRGLVDHLGRHGRIAADLRIDVVEGALHLVSTRVAFRVLGREWGLPSVVSPRVTLVERFDDEAGLQRVSLVLSAPVLGTLYRYEGAFDYSVVPDGGDT